MRAPRSLPRYLERGALDAGPAADWSVGHFVALVGLSEGRAGALVTVADTYPVLGAAASTSSPSRPSPRRSRGAGCSSSPSRTSARRVSDAAGGVAELWDNGSPLPRLSSQPASAG